MALRIFPTSLPLPEIVAKATREYLAPRNEIEETVCSAFISVLNVGKVGVYDSFFELGGDSLKAIRVVSNLNNNGFTITIKDVLCAKTPEKIAHLISNHNSGTLGLDISASANPNDKVKLTDISQEDNSERMAKAEAILCDDIIRYKTNVDLSKVDVRYSPTFMQKYFYTYEATQVIKVCYEVETDVSKEDLLIALKKVIKEQSVLRTCYDQDEHIAYECSYNNDWFIPYYEQENVPGLIESLPALTNSNLLLGSCKLQSFIAVIKKNDGKHIICTYASHGIWDMFSAIILCKRLNAHIMNKSLDEVYKYSEYVSSLKNNRCDNNEVEHICNDFIRKSTELLHLLKNNMKKSALAYVKLDVPGDKKENFKSLSMEKTFELLLKVNPVVGNIGYIPFIILYHGRSDVDENMTGIKLSILPAMYSVKERKIIGGTSLLNSDKSVPAKLNDESFYNLCYSPETSIYIFNNRGIFDGELGECGVNLENPITVEESEENDGFYQSASLSFDVIGDDIIITLPVYMSDDTDVKSYVEEKLKDIEELYD